jgi:hypothetical protein
MSTEIDPRTGRPTHHQYFRKVPYLSERECDKFAAEVDKHRHALMKYKRQSLYLVRTETSAGTKVRVDSTKMTTSTMESA